MARKKLNRNQRQKKRQEKLKQIAAISIATVEIQVHPSGLPRTPTIDTTSFEYPSITNQKEQNKTNITPESIEVTQQTEDTLRTEPDGKFLTKLEKRFIELFGSI